MPASTHRTAHPYRDLDVIDARAPCFNQAAIGSLSLVAVLTGFWPILALLAAQLAIGLRFGRRYCVACVVYFEWSSRGSARGRSKTADPALCEHGRAGRAGLCIRRVRHWPDGPGAAPRTPRGRPCPAGRRHRPVRRVRGLPSRGTAPWHQGPRVRPRRTGEMEDAYDVGPRGVGGAATWWWRSAIRCAPTAAISSPSCASTDGTCSPWTPGRGRSCTQVRISLVPTAVSVSADGRVLDRLAG
jgi:hypothetical protein